MTLTKHVRSKNRGVWGLRNFKYATWAKRVMICTTKLNEWWYDCGEFQTLRIPCLHAIAVCASCNLNCDDFVDHIYKLKNIYKVDQHQFHFFRSEDKWPQYLGPYFMPDSLKRRDTAGRSITIRIHNEINEPIPNRHKKCLLYRTKGHNHSNCSYKQVDD